MSRFNTDEVTRADYNRVRKFAEENKILFDVSIEEWKNIMYQQCYYCTDIGTINTDGLWHNTVDRYRPKMGWTRLNMCAICNICCELKGGVLTGDLFILQSQKIARKFGRQRLS